MDRIRQAVGADLSTTFESAGTAVDPDPDPATVEILRVSDGSVLIAERPADPAADAGEFSTHLTPDETAALDTLQLVWRATFDGELDTLETRAEIVGGFYFTISEFRRRFPDVTAEDYSADDIATARATAEDIIEGLDAEDGTHVAFVPRADTFRISGAGNQRIAIPRNRVRRVTALAIDEVTEPQLENVVLEASSVFLSHWPSGFSNVTITVEHGYDAPPARIKDAAMILAYQRLVKGSLDDRTISQQVDGGTVTYAQPGIRGSITGIPEVDATIKQYARKKPRVRSIVTTDRGNQFPANDWLWRYRR